MPFGLKNTSATYQRLVDKAFDSQIGQNIEVYVDDLVIKSYTKTEMLRDIDETFCTLRRINMKLNPKKYTFGAVEGMFLGSGTSLQAAEAALVGATPAGSTQTKGGTDCIHGPELNYTPMEKLVLALVFAAKRLRRYFQAHPIAILADFLIEKPDEEPPDTPRGTEFTYALRFQFTASNNEAEYEALIAGLWIAAQMGVHNVNAKSLISGFANFSISQVPRSKNNKADALSKIASTSFAHLSKQVLVEVLKEKSIQEEEVATVVEEEGPTWMTPIIEYLKYRTLPDDRKEASKLRIKARQYELLEGVLYRRSFLKPWLKCVGPLQANYVIREIHEGSCSMHAGPRSVVAKAM
ncbi:reverse transcriptase domain-containing protein [Tanacetum coccineum]